MVVISRCLKYRAFLCLADVARFGHNWRKLSLFGARNDGSVGAVFWQPIKLWQILRCQFEAIFFGLLSLVVDATATAVDVEKTAGNSQRADVALFVDRFLKTAFTATIADLFPVAIGHFDFFADWFKYRNYNLNVSIQLTAKDRHSDRILVGIQITASGMTAFSIINSGHSPILSLPTATAIRIQ